MAAKTTTYAQGLLQLIFNATNTNLPTVVLNATTTPLTNLYVSLHTGALTAASTQQTNEVTYTGYTREAVTRTTGGWNVSSNAGTVTMVANLTFPQCAMADTTDTISYFGVGCSAATAAPGTLLYWGSVSPAITMATNVTPILTSSSTITET